MISEPVLNADTVPMKAFLYDHDAAIVAVVAVTDNPPPDRLHHKGKTFDWSGSTARLTDDGVEQLGWDYVQQSDGIDD